MPSFKKNQNASGRDSSRSVEILVCGLPVIMVSSFTLTISKEELLQKAHEVTAV